MAAGVVFYSLLAIFPAVAAFVSLYGLIADASTIDAHLSLASGILPAGAVDILHEQITKLAAKSDAKLSLGFLTGVGVALWSANAGMKAIIDALNVVYDEKEKRSFVKLKLELLAKCLSEVNFPAPGGGEPGWVRRGRSCSRRHG